MPVLLRIIPVAALLAASVAFAQPAAITETPKGKTLVDEKGMTLYFFDRDAAGKSNCNDSCAENWPPLLAGPADQASGEWSIVTREDGRLQWAYKARPLYGWVKDSKPGDATGDGVNNVWHAARP